MDQKILKIMKLKLKIKTKKLLNFVKDLICKLKKETQSNNFIMHNLKNDKFIG